MTVLLLVVVVVMRLPRGKYAQFCFLLLSQSQQKKYFRRGKLSWQFDLLKLRELVAVKKEN
jgi:hypothetical protein